MRPIVFAGPTIRKEEIASILDADCREPAAQGDVYRASVERPPAIGLIDGYFEMQPAVWHKEILWAMKEGVHVFGSSSMGALRAAELWQYGMVGAGQIFEAYRDGVMEDDDEVALVHGGPESGYVQCSDPMVNIRATLRKAANEGIISVSSAEAAIRFAKGLFYADRSYDALIEHFPELACLRRWLPSGAVDQKREDAIAMLQLIRDFLAGNPDPKHVDYVFEESLHWEVFRRSAGGTGNSATDSTVLAELNRVPAEGQRALEGALAWWLARRAVESSGLQVPSRAVVEAGEQLCRSHAIRSEEDLALWLNANRLRRHGLDQVTESAAMAAQAALYAGDALHVHLLQYLHWTGDYVTLLERARLNATDTHAENEDNGIT